MRKSRSWSEAFELGTSEMALVYDEILRPLFLPFTEDLLVRGMIVPGQAVLDLACGPGTVTEPLAMRIGPRGRVFGVDISPVMIEMAMSKAPADGAARIHWLQAPVGSIPLEPDSIDLITCQQGLQFFPSLEVAFEEARTLLKPNGFALYSFQAPIEKSPIFAAFMDGLADFEPEFAAQYHAGPWALSGDQAHGVASKIGFNHVALEQVTLAAETPKDLARTLIRSLKVTSLAQELSQLPPEQLDVLVASVDSKVSEIAAEPMAIMTSWVLTIRN